MTFRRSKLAHLRNERRLALDDAGRAGQLRIWSRVGDGTMPPGITMGGSTQEDARLRKLVRDWIANGGTTECVERGDAGSPTGAADSGAADAGFTDAGAPDTGPPDAGPPADPMCNVAVLFRTSCHGCHRNGTGGTPQDGSMQAVVCRLRRTRRCDPVRDLGNADRATCSCASQGAATRSPVGDAGGCRRAGAGRMRTSPRWKPGSMMGCQILNANKCLAFALALVATPALGASIAKECEGVLSDFEVPGDPEVWTASQTAKMLNHPALSMVVSPLGAPKVKGAVLSLELSMIPAMCCADRVVWYNNGLKTEEPTRCRCCPTSARSGRRAGRFDGYLGVAYVPPVRAAESSRWV